MSKWQAIVFDLDDTLYPEKAYVLSGFRAVAAWAEIHLGLSAGQSFNELKSLFEQGVRGSTFNQWLEFRDLHSPSLISQLVQVYREHKPILAPYPEIPGLLETLRRYYRLGLLSDGYLAVQQRKLAALGLIHYFDAVVFSDEWGRGAWKPSPKPFEIVLQQLSLVASQAMYIADNPIKDFLGARQTGMFTIWLRRPEGEYSHLAPPTEKHAADLMIESQDRLETFLLKNSGLPARIIKNIPLN